MVSKTSGPRGAALTSTYKLLNVINGMATSRIRLNHGMGSIVMKLDRKGSNCIGHGRTPSN